MALAYAGRFAMSPTRTEKGAPIGTNARWNGLKLVAKIDAAQNDAGRGALELFSEIFTKRALFNPIAQSQELFFTLGRRGPRHTFQIIQCSGTDGAGYLSGAIHYRK